MKLRTDWTKVPKDVIDEITKLKGFETYMGFTRYYKIRGKLDKDRFEDFSSNCKILCELVSRKWGINIGGPDGDGGEPTFSKESVEFNGIGKDSHESFILDLNSNGFNFTKTQLKPYDKHVEACLILAKYYFGDTIEVSSDGSDEIDSEIEILTKESIRNFKISEILDKNSNI